MSNHGPNPFEGFGDEDKPEFQRMQELRRQLLDTTGFVGALGQFTEKPLTKDDEGAIQFAIGSQGDKVIIDFGTQVHWVAMSPEQAAELASTLLKRAREVGRREGKMITFQL